MKEVVKFITLFSGAFIGSAVILLAPKVKKMSNLKSKFSKTRSKTYVNAQDNFDCFI